MASVDTFELLGSEKIVYFTHDGKKCCAKVSSDYKCGDRIEIGISMSDVHYFDKVTGQRM